MVFGLNLVFTVIELVGGILTGSMAILADAVHDLGDTASIGLALIFNRLARRRRDRTFSYGYRRLELLSALLNSVVLLIGSAVIIYEAIPRLLDPQPVDSLGMLLLAVVGIVFNGIAVLRLRQGEGANERVVQLHLLEDVLGWGAVLVGGLVIQVTDWFWIDPVLSVGISLFILVRVFGNLKRFVIIFLQGVPEGVSLEDLEAALSRFEAVRSTHDIHVWSLDGRYNILSAHVVIDDEVPAGDQIELKNEIKAALHALDIEHVTLEMEYYSEYCDYQEC